MNCLIRLCLKACIMHRDHKITVRLSIRNVFYNPNQEVFQLVPIIDNSFDIHNGVRMLIGQALEDQDQLDEVMKQRALKFLQQNLEEMDVTQLNQVFDTLGLTKNASHQKRKQIFDRFRESTLLLKDRVVRLISNVSENRQNIANVKGLTRNISSKQ